MKPITKLTQIPENEKVKHKNVYSQGFVNKKVNEVIENENKILFEYEWEKYTEQDLLNKITKILDSRKPEQEKMCFLLDMVKLHNINEKKIIDLFINEIDFWASEFWVGKYSSWYEFQYLVRLIKYYNNSNLIEEIKNNLSQSLNSNIDYWIYHLLEHILNIAEDIGTNVEIKLELIQTAITCSLLSFSFDTLKRLIYVAKKINIEIKIDIILLNKFLDDSYKNFHRYSSLLKLLKDYIWKEHDIPLKIIEFLEDKDFLNKENYEEVLKTYETKGLEFWLYKVYLKEWLFDEINEVENFPITKNNFLELLNPNEPLFNFEQDKWINFTPKPWTKEWFEEDTKRFNYLNSKDLETFEKVWTIVWLWIIEWAENSKKMSSFYSNIFEKIWLENSRSSILQLSEVFNLILRKENYDIFDELVESKFDIWNTFRTFIEDNSISDKWRTIITLLIASEIRDSFQIFTASDWEKQVDTTKVEVMLKSVYDKLNKYNELIKIYSDLPIKTSIWMEYEVTQWITDWYKEDIWSDYKTDIEILSQYSWIAKWNDAVHEIATKPTDNPLLLLLEMNLLQRLDFLDLNFKKEDYNKWSRWMHLTLGWENWVKLDHHTNFIQNILIFSNLWWVNAWEEIKKINTYKWNILEKNWDCEVLFWDEETECTELRWLSIDKTESFERMIMSGFNLTMAKQAVDKYLKYDKFISAYHNAKLSEILQMERFGYHTQDKLLNDFEFFKKYLKDNNLLTEKINDERIYKLLFEFVKINIDIEGIIDDHNKNFEENETISWDFEIGLEKILLLLTSTWPIVSIMSDVWIDLKYLKNLENIEPKQDFLSQLKKDWKDIKKLTPREEKTLFWKNIKNITTRREDILFLNYKSRILPIFKELKNDYPEIYNNIWEYLNWNTDETIRKITNSKRFKEVIKSSGQTYSSYIQSVKFWKVAIYQEITADLVNRFTRLNNLFVKKDSTNALSLLETTKEPNWEINSSQKASETSIFDKIDKWLAPRKWHNVIQWASDKMLTQAIQKRILEFNENILKIL